MGASNEMWQREPCSKIIKAQEKWCCGSPGCPHILASVVSLDSGTVLELPPDYEKLRDFYGLRLYGPASWINGPMKLMQRPAPNGQKGALEKVSFRNHQYRGTPQSHRVIQLKGAELPIFIACRSGHAIHRINFLRFAPRV